MILSDFHTHTSFSTDADASPREMLDRAVALGLHSYCITDHMDPCFPSLAAKPGAFTFDPENYFSVLNVLREEYADRLNLRIGIELGLRNEPILCEKVLETCTSLIRRYPFDFVIGSTHCICNQDPYLPEYWEGFEGTGGIDAYWEACLHNVSAYPCFDSCGHLDYIYRYVPSTISYRKEDYHEIITEILRVLISQGKGIEVNTACLAKGFIEPHPSLFALKQFLALGGEILTIGSDAHSPEKIAADFRTVSDLLTTIGYRYYTTFTGRIPSFHRIQ